MSRRTDSFSAVIWGILFLAVCAYGAVSAWEWLGGVKTVSLAISHTAVGTRIRGIAVRHERVLEKDEREYENGARLPAGDPASCSVLYISECDGFEYLTPEMLCGMSGAELEKITQSRGGEKGRYGKTVSGFEWYIAAVSENGKSPAEGSVLSAELPDGSRHRAECVYAPRDGEDGVFLLRLTDGDPQCELRRLDALLIEKEIRGFAVPASAVHTDGDGRSFVFAVRSGRAQAAEVEILHSEENTCFVSAQELSEGERIIVSGRDIYHGKVIS